MEYFGIVTEQKWVENYEWNDMTFNKYLIKFNGNDQYYTISRNTSIEQAIIGAKMTYSLKESQFDNRIDRHKIIGYSTKDEIQYKLVSIPELKEMLLEMYHKGKNHVTTK